MLAQLNTTNAPCGDGYDQIVIRHAYEDKVGGRTIDASEYPKDFIRRGHLIIKAADGTLKPMPLAENGNAYGDLPASHTYYGVANQTAFKQGEGIQVGILERFEMNHKVVDPIAGVYGLAGAQLTAVKEALPLATFKGDQD